MAEIKVYIACCKTDLYLLKSCIASIRYWNKDVHIALLKDFSKGKFDTTEIERIFKVVVVQTKYKRLGFYMKLQPFIEHPDERIFLQDTDMVWLGDMMDVLNNIDSDFALQAYKIDESEKEVFMWYLDIKRLKECFPAYNYPGFVFNTGSILFNSKKFTESDFDDVISWQENTTPKYSDILREDQGIINYIVAQKYLTNSITISKVDLQISAEDDAAKTYKLENILRRIPRNIIVHWYGKKNGLNAFCSSSHLLRFYEKQYYSHFKNGNFRMLRDRLLRTIKHFDMFVYEFAKKIYYTFIPRKK